MAQKSSQAKKVDITTPPIGNWPRPTWPAQLDKARLTPLLLMNIFGRIVSFCIKTLGTGGIFLVVGLGGGGGQSGFYCRIEETSLKISFLFLL